MSFILNSCPFCGGRAAYATDHIELVDDVSVVHFYVGCTKCGATMKKAKGLVSSKIGINGDVVYVHDDRPGAAKYWNLRKFVFPHVWPEENEDGSD